MRESSLFSSPELKSASGARSLFGYLLATASNFFATFCQWCRSERRLGSSLSFW